MSTRGLTPNIQEISDRFKRKRLEEKWSEEEILEALKPLESYAQPKITEVENIFASNSSARDSIFEFHFKKGVVDRGMPAIRVPFTEEYRAGHLSTKDDGSGMRDLDKEEKDNLTQLLLPLLKNMPSYKMANIVLGNEVSVKDAGSLFGDRVVEFFTSPLGGGAYQWDKNKFEQNKEKFARACRQINIAHIIKHFIWTAARKDAAFLAYLVAIPLHCLR